MHRLQATLAQNEIDRDGLNFEIGSRELNPARRIQALNRRDEPRRELDTLCRSTSVRRNRLVLPIASSEILATVLKTSQSSFNNLGAHDFRNPPISLAPLLMGGRSRATV